MKVDTFKKKNNKILLVGVFIIILSMICSKIVEFSAIEGIASVPKAIGWLFTEFIPTKEAFNKMPDIVSKLIETILLSIATTTTAAIFALFFVCFGVLTRAFIETIDEASNEAVEALEATGASKTQIVFQAIIPSSLTQMISWILYMIETNIRSSTLIGILTGTGIGFIFDLYYKNMNYAVASLVVISIIIAVFIIEFISNSVRRVIL